MTEDVSSYYPASKTLHKDFCFARRSDMASSNKDIIREFKHLSETLFFKVTENCAGLPGNTKQKIFLSFSYGIERAQTVNGVGNSLRTAYETARNAAVKALKGKDALPKWMMINVVTEETTVLLEAYYRMLKETRRGYLRYGISFDEMYNTAFLEQEIYGNSLIKYIKRSEQYFNTDNITNYLKKNKQYGGKFSFALDENKPIILFETKSYFYDEGEYTALESSVSALHKGIRYIEIGTSQEEQAQSILALTAKTADALLSTLNNDGSFIYGYFPCFSAIVPGYNVPRHALAIYSLADFYLLKPELKYKEGALSALSYMLDKYVYYHDDETAFIIDPIRENEVEIKLGALGMAILAITKCMELMSDNEKYLPLLRKLGNGILYLQNKETGNYTHVLSYPSMEVKEEFRIVYYAGEACFALTRLYTADRDEKWMDSIDLAFDFFIDNDYHRYSDHWLAYAVNEISLYKTEDKYFAFGLKNAFYDLDFIIERDTTWNTFLEMLNVSVLITMKIKALGKDYLLEGYDLKKLLLAFETRFNKQLASVMFPEMAMFFKFPQTVLHGIFIRHHSFRVRDDDTAHHLMGYSNYLRIKYSDVIISNIKVGMVDSKEKLIPITKDMEPSNSKNDLPISLVFSADRNDVVYLQGNKEQKIGGGLGLPLLLYHLLLNINKKKILWTDIVKIDKYAERENWNQNSLGLVNGEEIDVFTLFCAATSVNAPDAIIAMGRHLFDTVGEMKNGTVASLKKLSRDWGLSKECVKNLTGRCYDSIPQHFTVGDLIIVAKEVLSFDIQNKLMQKSIVYRNKYLCCESILTSDKHITRYFCFGEESNHHSIAVAEYKEETLYVAVCGAETPLERDAAVLKAIHYANNTETDIYDEEWVDSNKSILTICGDTYCGERYTKWRKSKNIDDPIQRYGDAGYVFSFENVKQFITHDSYNIVNSECVLSPVYDKTQQTGKYIDFVLGANPDKTIACYKQMNIDSVMLANNHMMDFGAVGCRQTKRYFEEAGILPIGAGADIDEAEKPICLNMNGQKVILFNAYGFFTEKRHRLFQHYVLGENTGAAFISDLLRDCSMFERIKKYREMYPDAFIILSPHWSTDFNEKHRHLRPIAKKAVEAGIDLIVGHGPHIPVGVEHVSKKIVVYSLGNFVFNTTGIDLDASGKLPYGVITQLHFQSGKILLQLYPIYAHNLDTFFQPRPVNKDQFNEFLSTFFGANKFKETKNKLGYCLELKIRG